MGGGNLEVVEHLHPSFAADAIADVAGFWEALAARAERARVVCAQKLRSSLFPISQKAMLTGSWRVRST